MADPDVERGWAAADAAVRLSRVAVASADLAHHVDSVARGLDGRWRGAAADACRGRLAEHSMLTGAVADVAGRAAGVLRRLSGDPPGPSGVGDELEMLAAEARLLGARLRSRLAEMLHTAPDATAEDLAQVGLWWAGLSAATQDRLLAANPAEVGAMAGLPLEVRGAANERVLAAELAGLEAALAGRPLTVGEARHLLSARAAADALALARASRDPATGRTRAASLLAYDSSFGGGGGGEGRAAVVVGDAETADDLAVLVPGLGSDVAGTLEPLTATAIRLADTAARAAPDEQTAVVAWMGYDAPGPATVATALPAVLGARLLTRDLRSVLAARGRDAHVTVVGHSYGSTTAAAAAQDGAPVDDLVLLGSPGALARSASELGPPGHVFVGADSDDPVSYLGWFGPDPALADFGAVRIPAESPATGPGLDLRAHFGYDAAGSEALASVGRIVVGDADRLEVAAPRTPGWLPGSMPYDPERERAAG